MKVFTVADMVAAEKAADSLGHSYALMMELAGRGIAEAIMGRGEMKTSRVLILVGAGNNGGDGLVAGRYLAEAGAIVTVYLSQQRDDDNFHRLPKPNVNIVYHYEDQTLDQLYRLASNCDVLIDALLGTGVTRPITGNFASILRQVAAARGAWKQPDRSRTLLSNLAQIKTVWPLVVAVDCPSGLNCDTGEIDPLALSADLTVTFAGPKRGHFIFLGAAACGELEVVDIGIDPQLTDAIPIDVATPARMQQILPQRPLDGHKGTFGSVLIAGASADYLGAPILSAFGALRAGSGLVALAVPQTVRNIAATQLPEATYPLMPDEVYLGSDSAETLQSILPKYKALLLGPGLGQQSDSFLTSLFLASLLGTLTLPPLVLDADALNYLAGQTNWWEHIPANSILTPHPGEMARLAKIDMRGQDRIAVAQMYAQKWRQIVVLKGAYTVIATPDGHSTLIPVATPLLAIAGSGDVLAGIIASLLGQGAPPEEAAVLGAYLHATVGKRLTDTFGDAGLLAREIADALPSLRQTLALW
ncbi:MAG: NAD(P)H-hydrate dehydratase [Candidatus Promineifilaceae bacterium]